MSDVTRSVVNQNQRITTSELRKLPLEERNAILEAQAALAESIYRNDPRMTDFEAFGEDDLHGECSSAEAG
ncbi:MAG: hypothetical protein ACHRXM_08730 [Isosphaerales bacterium]